MKSKFFCTLLLLFTAVFFSTCRVDNWPCGKSVFNYIRIVQYGTHKFIEGADVFLMRPGSSGNNLYVVKQTTSDVNGWVQWDCELEIEDICASAPGYWNYCGSGYNLNETYISDQVYELSPKAWLRLHIVDDEPLNPELRFYHDNGYSGTGYPTFIQEGYPQVLPWHGEKDDLLRIYKHVLVDGALVYDSRVEISLYVFHLDTLEYTYHY